MSEDPRSTGSQTTGGLAPEHPLSERDIKVMTAALGRHWGLALVVGLATVGLGICLLVWPGHTLVAISVLLGAYLLVSGIFQIIASFTVDDASGGMRVLVAISGVLSVILGLFAFRSVAHSLAILALLIGFGWLLRGLSQLMAAIGDHQMPMRGWQIFMGALGIVAGLVVLVWPIGSLATLAWVGGVFMLVIGVFEIFGAFRLRSLR